MSKVGELLREGADRLTASGSPSPRLDAELLLGHAIGADRTAILAHPDAPVGSDAETTFRGELERRAAGEPVAYIRGLKEFHGIALTVDARALIPRPETELLVDLAVADVMRRLAAGARPTDSPPLRVADVGTGSGAVAIALIVALRARRAENEVRVLATDISPDALDLARENAVGHAVADQLSFAEADLLPSDVEPFDLVLANMPYVRSDVVPTLPVAASFEPVMALDGGQDGLSAIARLVDRLPEVLVDGGTAFLEIGADQGETAPTLVAARHPGWPVTVETDLSGLPRVVRVSRGSSPTTPAPPTEPAA